MSIEKQIEKLDKKLQTGKITRGHHYKAIAQLMGK